MAERAEVGQDFIRRALDAGAVAESDGGFTADDATRLRFLKAWDDAGLRVETVGDLLRKGEITFSFLKVPWLMAPRRSTETYEELAAQRGLDLANFQQVHEALGFAPPAPTDGVREDDRALADWFQVFGQSMSQQGILRLLRVYAGSLRRIAQAEAELFESEVEDRLRAAGAAERDLLDIGGDIGTRLTGLLEEAILAIYRRQRQHVWLDHSVKHIEIILEAAGLYERLDAPPCVCFVDITGYTRLTEERGDHAAAQLAGSLTSLVEGIARRYDGRAVKWLGDGGLLVFRDAASAVAAATEMVVQPPDSGLPPRHIGIHCGPVVFQDGDLYGRTVNIAARLSSRAGAGEVLISSAVAERLAPDNTLDDIGAVPLKGVAEHLRAFRVVASPSGPERLPAND